MEGNFFFLGGDNFLLSVSFKENRQFEIIR